MRVAIRCIYYKAVTPSCDVVDMPEKVWNEFLYADAERRRTIACELTNHEEVYVREVARIPLDNNLFLTKK